MTQLNKILIAVLAVQAVLVVSIWSSQGTATIQKPKPVLAEFEGDSVTRVEIFDRRTEDSAGADEGDGASPAMVLARADDGWTIASARDYPASADKVDKLVSKLGSMMSREPMATSEGRAKQLEVAADHYDRKVVLRLGDGDGAASRVIFLGTAAGSGKIAARAEGTSAIHAVDSAVGRSAYTKVADWAQQPYVDIDKARIQSMQVENENLTAALRKDDSGSWSLDEALSTARPKKDQRLDSAYVKKLVSAVSSIRLEDVAGAEMKPAYGLDEPKATVTVALSSSSGEEGEDAAATGGDGDANTGAAGDTGAAKDKSASAGDGAQAGGDDEAGSGSGSGGMSVAEETYTITIGALEDGSYYVKDAYQQYVVRVKKSAIHKLVSAEKSAMFTSDQEQEEKKTKQELQRQMMKRGGGGGIHGGRPMMPPGR